MFSLTFRHFCTSLTLCNSSLRAMLCFYIYIYTQIYTHAYTSCIRDAESENEGGVQVIPSYYKGGGSQPQLWQSRATQHFWGHSEVHQEPRWVQVLAVRRLPTGSVLTSSTRLLWIWKAGVTQRPQEHCSPRQLKEPSFDVHLGHRSCKNNKWPRYKLRSDVIPREM